MQMIEITEDKITDLSEHLEKGLRHIGKAMQCIDELSQESRMGERDRYGNRGGRYGNRMGYRDEEDEWEDYGDDPYMGERRGRSMRTGRYIRR